jgi:hypothetical protein
MNQLRVFFAFFISLLLITCHLSAVEIDTRKISGSCNTCDVKYGDRAMINAIMLATGPGYRETSFEGYKGVTKFQSNVPVINQEIIPSKGDWTDVFNYGNIAYDLGLNSNTELGDVDLSLCANYASICPGTYSYDKNGIRIDHPGGGDPTYRLRCCGSYPWTPTNIPSDKDSYGEQT